MTYIEEMMYQLQTKNEIVKIIIINKYNSYGK